MSYKELAFGDLQIDPKNRRQYRGIADLGRSIGSEGLIQPLRVRYSTAGEKRYTVTAGNRRLKAIEWLRDQAALDGKKKPFATVPCIVDEDVSAARVRSMRTAENTAREDKAPFEIGAEFLEAQRGGKSQEEIARSAAKSQAYVSKCIAVAKNLKPETIRLLRKARAETSISVCLILAKEPDRAKQLALAEKILSPQHRQKRKGTASPSSRARRVLEKLDRYRISDSARSAVRAVLEYVMGQSAELSL